MAAGIDRAKIEEMKRPWHKCIMRDLAKGSNDRPTILIGEQGKHRFKVGVGAVEKTKHHGKHSIGVRRHPNRLKTTTAPASQAAGILPCPPCRAGPSRVLPRSSVAGKSISPILVQAQNFLSMSVIKLT